MNNDETMNETVQLETFPEEIDTSTFRDTLYELLEEMRLP